MRGRKRRVLKADRVSRIQAGMEVHGAITAAGGDVLVEGVLHGAIVGAGVVYVGEKGAVHGDVDAQELIVAGEVYGDVRTIERCEVQSSGQVLGDVTALACLCLEGARVYGMLAIGRVDPSQVIEGAQSSGIQLQVTGGASPALPSQKNRVPIG